MNASRRSTLTAAAIFTAFTAAVLAQTPARDATVARLIGTAAMHGRIIDEERRPLKNAAVTIDGDMGMTRTTVTDQAGVFSFDGLPAGRFTVTAKRGGYPDMSYGAKRPYRAGSGILLADAQPVRDISIALARGAVLTGTVYDDLGQPMPGVPILAWEVKTTLSGERRLDFPATGGEWATTDDRGVYRVFGLPPGEYIPGTSWQFHGTGRDARVPSDADIRAAFQSIAQNTPLPQSPNASAAAQTLDFSAVFHPNAVDPLSAVVVKLAAGEERAGADIRMLFQPMTRIEATILDGGQPANARIAVFRRSPIDALNTTTVSSTRTIGTFATSAMPPGDYTLLATAPAEPGKPARFAMADLTLTGPEPSRLTLNLQQALVVTGRVVFQGDSLPAPDFRNVSVNVVPLQGTQADTTTERSPLDASGNFTITGITPGRYRLSASAGNPSGPSAPAWRLRTVIAGGQDVTDLPITINAGDAIAVTVTFGDQTSELSGRIITTSGQPAPDYFVVVLPIDRKYWQSRRIRSTRPDANGRYAFYGLPAGDYQIALTTDLEQDDLNDTGALELLASQAARVMVGYGEKRALDLKVGG